MGSERSVAQRAASAATAGLTAADQRRYGSDPSARVRLVVARRADLVDDVAAALAQDPDPKIRRALVENPAADTPVHLAALAGSHADTADAVGQLGDRLHGEAVDAVLAHPRWQVRQQLALSTSSQEVLKRLADDPTPAVRAAVAQSCHAQEAVLRQLAADRRAEVRAAAATSSSTPREVVEELARDRSSKVRFWVTANAQYDEEMASLQFDDPDEDVRLHARTRAKVSRSPDRQSPGTEPQKSGP